MFSSNSHSKHHFAPQQTAFGKHICQNRLPIMTTRKRLKRQEETAASFSLEAEAAREQTALAEAANEDLFVVDRGGSKAAKRKITVEASQAKVSSKSKTERNLIRKIKGKSIYRSNDRGEDQVADIWSDGDSAATAGGPSSSTRKKRKVVVRPGQSYNPSSADHQDILAEALALEIEKREKDVRAAGKDLLLSVPEPIVVRLSGPDGDSDSSDEGSEEEGGSGRKSTRSRRRDGKLTRAQRNKMRERKIKSFEELKSKTETDILKGIQNTEKYLKAIEEEETRLRKKQELKKLYDRQNEFDPSRLTYEEASAVPLSDELRGSLRQVTPKGALVGNRIAEMRNSGELTKRDRKRRHFENPHGASKVVWVPKYKYV